MKLLPISSSTTLSDLSKVAGSRNVSELLAANSVPRTQAVGKTLQSIQSRIASSSGSPITSQRKVTLLNKLRNDSDLFEEAALMNEDSWKVFNTTNAFIGTLLVPDTLKLIDGSSLKGNGNPVPASIANKAVDQMQQTGKVDPAIFNSFQHVPGLEAEPSPTSSAFNLFQFFHIPWGEVSLYSSLADTYVDFPVYPETFQDKVSANYDTMPDMIYQYEPWYTYKSSGPRSNTYSFEFHRDMWTGDHRDGMAYKLVQFCKANCYARYNGSTVQTAYVTLIIGGVPEISGIMESADVEWSGPVGLDNHPLVGKLNITITEVAKEALSYDYVMNKSYITN